MTERRRWGAWDLALVVLLVGSVGVVFWHSASKDPATRQALEWLDLGLCALFVVEWAWRGVRSGHPVRFGLAHSWELLGMIPIVAPLPSFLRVLRLARLVRIIRLFGRLGDVVGVWERIVREGNILKVGAASGLITLTGAVLVWLLERDVAGTHIPDLETSLWWAIVTVTTVGYGDVTPITVAGRFVAACLMVTGIGTIGLLASSLASVLVLDRKRDEDASAAPPAFTGGLTQELQALASLHAAGQLTDAEFAAAKARLLR